MSDPSKKEYDQRLPNIHGYDVTKDPTIKVRQYPDGRREVWQTLKGHETHKMEHSAGNYDENRADGTRVMFTSNNTIIYAKGGMTLSIDNNGDIKLVGHSRINIDTDAHITTGKHASIVVGGDCDVYAGGHIKLAATDIGIQSTAGSIVFNAARDIELRADKGRISGHSSGVTSFTTEQGDFHVNSAGKVQTFSKLNTEINSEAEIDTTSKADTNITAGPKITEKAGRIDLNP